MTQKTDRESAETPLGTYLREINETPLLTPEEERMLVHKIDSGDAEATQHMIKANLRLVVTIARNYMGKGLDLQDLIEEGNLGLIRAVTGFDPEQYNTRFSTYASYWIKQAISHALVNTAKTVRLPAYMTEKITKWKKAESQLRNELHRTPTPEEVIARLGIAGTNTNLIKHAANLHLRQTGQDQEVLSLDELAADPESSDMPARLGHTEDLGKMLRILDIMKDRRAASIIELRYGLNGDEKMSLKQIGEKFGITRERVRQIEVKTLKKMRKAMQRHSPLE